MAGYSGTPLARKLGIAERARVQVVGAPKSYRALLEPLPPNVDFASKLDRSIHLVHVFTTERAALAKVLRSCRDRLEPQATVWVSWPKKSAKVPTDITEDTISELRCRWVRRRQGLRGGRRGPAQALVVRKELR